MIYIWRTSHQINDTVSMAIHTGLPESIIKDISHAPTYIKAPNKLVAIAYGVLRGTNDIFEINRSAGVDFWEIDRGYINPDHFDGYYRVSRNNFQAAYTNKSYPDDRLRRLKFKFTNLYDARGHVLVCPPTEAMERVYHMAAGKWLQEIEAFLKRNQINYRVRVKAGNTTPLERDLTDCRCVITYNSNVAIDATLASIPVIVGNNSVCFGWTPNTLAALAHGEVRQPTENEIGKLLRFVSYQQFTLDEFRDGLPWKKLKLY